MAIETVGKATLALLLSLMTMVSHAQSICTPENQEALEKVIYRIQTIDNLDQSFSDRNIQIGKLFLDTPYVEKTLEVTDDEFLVINLLGMDCTTFVESVLALNRSVELLDKGRGPFENSLTFIRYRAGIRDGYTSRLHYFSEWISDAVAKGLLVDVTQELGGLPYENKPTFMTENPRFYPQLSDPRNFASMQVIEKSIASKAYFYIPKSEVKNVESNLQNGDLIAITANLSNLDMVHVGFAVEKNGRMHLLHESSVSKKVEISAKPIHEYLQTSKSQSGIMVGRFRP